MNIRPTRENICCCVYCIACFVPLSASVMTPWQGCSPRALASRTQICVLGLGLGLEGSGLGLGLEGPGLGLWILALTTTLLT